MKPSIDDLCDYFSISQSEKGLVFVSDSGRYGKYKARTKAGSVQISGHRVVCFRGKYYPESNVVWAIHHGEWPTGSISYFNGDLQDNRPQNLYASGGGKSQKLSEKDISIERLRFLFSYDSETGNLIRNVAKPPNTKAGDIAGHMSDQGYFLVNVDGLLIRVHRVIWAINKGKWPDNNLDHIDGIRTHNKMENLREVMQAENMQNSFVRRNSRTGIKGVRLREDTGKYHAYIQINKKMIDLGCYVSIEDAIVARKDAEIKHHPFRKK